MANYKVNVGIDFPPNRRAEAGEIVTDTELPSKSIKWLVEQGVIELVSGGKSRSASAVVAEESAEEVAE